jgi:hypothetical protein
MTAGQKAATLRLIQRGRHPVLACEDLEVSPSDLICALAEDEQFCLEWCGLTVAFNRMTFEERFSTD